MHEAEYGQFGNLREGYRRARKGVPEEVLDYLWEYLPEGTPSILDVGCGTGIPTRQLAERGARVTATDNDSDMIAAAQEDTPESADITYRIAPAEDQPFAGSQFDAVTAFSAFHWFATEKAVTEIQRMLKEGGVFFVVNKNEAGDFKRGYKNILQRYISEELPAIKRGYNPERVLRENGFPTVYAKAFPTTELYTFEEALDYLQSVSIWNLVPEARKEEAREELRRYCRQRLERHGIRRELELSAVAATRS